MIIFGDTKEDTSLVVPKEFSVFQNLTVSQFPNFARFPQELNLKLYISFARSPFFVFLGRVCYGW